MKRGIIIRQLVDRSRDFAEEVAPIFQYNNWTYGMLSNEYVPGVEKIHSTILELLSDINCDFKSEKEQEHSACSTGRLQVRIDKYNDEWHGCLELVPNNMWVCDV